jgi:hypothetical protein
MNPTRRIVISGLVCLALIGLLSGCVVSQQVFLEEATITAPISRPPVMFPPDSGESVQLVGHLSFAQATTLNGKATEDVYAPSGEDNLHWKIPEMTGGIAADIRLGEHVSWTAAIDFSSGGGNSLIGGATGLALHSMGGDAGVWFGFGLLLHPIQYDSRLLVVTTTSGWGSTSVDSSFFHDKGESMALDFYLGLTVKSRFRDFPVNLFADLMLTRQSLISHGLSQPDELHPGIVTAYTGTATYRTLVFAAAPGLAVRITEGAELVGGVWLYFSGDIEGLFENSKPAPFIQIQMHF